MTHRGRHRTLVAAGALLAACGAATLVPATGRTAQAQAGRGARAPHVAAAPPCAPSALNRSAVLPGTSISVSPLPVLSSVMPAVIVTALAVVFVNTARPI